MIANAAKRLVLNALPEPAVRRLCWWQARVEALVARLEYSVRARQRHSLRGELIVSLTSYPPRFASLPLTLRSLLRQTLIPDRIILWIAEDDLPLLPAKVRAFEKAGISIRGCEDLKSYKKLVPALEEYPDAFIVTADDDAFYRPAWLEELVSEYDPSAPAIVCHRAHRLRLAPNGHVAPYLSWQWQVTDAAARAPSVDIVPTGCGGIFYPPGSLHPDVTNRKLLQELAPTADDLWFYWMGQRAGSRSKVVNKSSKLILWPHPPEQTLMGINHAGENDRQIRALEERLGTPCM